MSSARERARWRRRHRPAIPIGSRPRTAGCPRDAYAVTPTTVPPPRERANPDGELCASPRTPHLYPLPAARGEDNQLQRVGPRDTCEGRNEVGALTFRRESVAACGAVAPGVLLIWGDEPPRAWFWPLPPGHGVRRARRRHHDDGGAGGNGGRVAQCARRTDPRPGEPARRRDLDGRQQLPRPSLGAGAG